MKNFEYTVREDNGEARVGLCQAASEQDVRTWLNEQGSTPISVKVLRTGGRRNLTASSRKRVKSEDMAAFCWQLSTLIEGGVSVADAIDVIADDIDNLQLREIAGQISEKIKTGEAFSDCVAEYSKVFSSLFCSMILAGEAGGTLPVVLQRLATYYESRDRLTRKVKGAMLYPIFVTGFVVLIVVAMMVFIIPRFQAIFLQIKGEMPAFTKGFMRVYEALTSHGVYYLLVIGIAVATIVAYTRTRSGHERFSRIVLAIPFLGKVFVQSFIVMFCKTMSTLLSAGVSVIDSLDILTNMTRNDEIKAAITRTKDNIIGGASISLSMSASGIFPSMVSKMSQVGEETGSLPAVLDKTSEYYEKKVDSTISTLIGFLEPAMIIIVGAIVLTVVLALYLPVFSMSGV